MGIFPPSKKCLVCRKNAVVEFRHTEHSGKFGLCKKHAENAAKYMSEKWSLVPIESSRPSSEDSG